MKAKVFVLSLLIAVLSGCEDSEPASPFTAAREEMLYQPRGPREIASPGVPLQIISASDFVTIALEAGATSQLTAARCPTPEEVGNFMGCFQSVECGSRPALTDLGPLAERVHNGGWMSGDVGGQLVWFKNDSLGTIFLGDGNVNLSEFIPMVTSGLVSPGLLPLDGTILACGGVAAPCHPEDPIGQCTLGGNPPPRPPHLDFDLIVAALDQAVQHCSPLTE